MFQALISGFETDIVLLCDLQALAMTGSGALVIGA